MDEGSPLPLLPLLVVVVGGFMAMLDASIVNIAIPTLMGEFGVSLDRAEWVVTGYSLAMGVVVPLAGWLADRLGPKRLYLLSLGAFTAGSALCGLSWSIYSLIGFRVLQAAGGGMIFPVIMAMTYRMVAPEHRGAAMGVLGVAPAVAPALGPVLGGYLVEYVNWRFIFFINVPVGILGALAAVRVLPRLSPVPSGPFDLKGFVTAGTGLFALLFALSDGDRYGWGSPVIVLSCYAAAALLTLFVHYELTTAAPLLDLRLFARGAFTLSVALSALSRVALFSSLFYVPVYLQTVMGEGALGTGLVLVPAALVAAVMLPLAGALYDRVGPRGLTVLGFGVLAWGTFQLHLLGVDTPTRLVTDWLSVRGLGLALTMAVPLTAGLSALPTSQVSRGTALVDIVQRSSAAFGIALLTAFLERRQAAGENALAGMLTPGSAAGAFVRRLTRQSFLPHAQAHALAVARLAQLVAQQAFTRGVDDLFVVTAAVAAVGAVAALGMRSGRRRPAEVLPE